MKSSKKGGARVGAGRKPGRCKVAVGYRVSPEVKFMVDVMGKNHSAIIERAVWYLYCKFVSDYLLRQDKNENLAQTYVDKLNKFKSSL